eukprot:superscaffoldBa00005795_g20788
MASDKQSTIDHSSPRRSPALEAAEGRARLQQSADLVSFILELKTVLEVGLKSRPECRSIPPPQYYSQLISEMETLGWDKLLFIDTEFRMLRLKAEDSSGRQHILTINLKTKMTSTRDKRGCWDPTLCPPAHLALFTPLAPGKNSLQSSPCSSCLHQIQRQVIPHQAQQGRRQRWHGHMEAWVAGERKSRGKGGKVA